MKIILASASTARTKLLTEAKIPHDVEVSGVDEESDCLLYTSDAADE